MNKGHSPPRTADIVILGAGVMGASIAFHLAQRNPVRIIALDKDHVGHGASRRSSSSPHALRLSPRSAAGVSQPAHVTPVARSSGRRRGFSQDRSHARSYGVYDMTPDSRPLLGEISGR
jgi:2-polyprenyl-6-methoxyphenol hydroxylase-like FAD-dependent oxidoreductase